MTPYVFPGPNSAGRSVGIRRVRRWRRKLRWYLVTIPLAVMFASWLGQGTEPAFGWDDLLDALNVQDRTRVTQLAVLGVLVVMGLAIVRVVRARKRED